MSDRVKGACLTMGGAACWGVSGCMGQYLFTREGMDSTWLVPIRLFLAGLILWSFCYIIARIVRSFRGKGGCSCSAKTSGGCSGCGCSGQNSCKKSDPSGPKS